MLAGNVCTKNNGQLGLCKKYPECPTAKANEVLRKINLCDPDSNGRYVVCCEVPDFVRLRKSAQSMN